MLFLIRGSTGSPCSIKLKFSKRIFEYLALIFMKFWMIWGKSQNKGHPNVHVYKKEEKDTKSHAVKTILVSNLQVFRFQIIKISTETLSFFIWDDLINSPFFSSLTILCRHHTTDRKTSRKPNDSTSSSTNEHPYIV